jgi:hypothetical protein
MMSQATLTIVTEVVPEGVSKLREMLADLGGQRGHSRLPFADVGGVHFARFAVVEDPDGWVSGRTSPADGWVSGRTSPADAPSRPDPVLPPLLVFSLVFDRPSTGSDDCLERVVAAARESLDAIYASSTGYPGAGAAATQVKEYLLSKNVEPLLFYQGAEGVTVNAVEASGALRQKLENELDRLMRGGAVAEPPVAVARALRAAVAPVDPQWVPTALERLSKPARFFRMAAWNAIVFLAPAVVLVGVPWAIGWLFGAPEWLRAALAATPAVMLAIAIFVAERVDAGRITPEPDVTRSAHLKQVRDEEDRLLRNALIAQNALTHCAIVKPGWLRYGLLQYVFWAIGWRVRLVDRYDGALGGIGSIHFARWVQLDQERGRRRRRLLFLSDYDGSWESYLGEFVDRASNGLTAVWSNTENFPKTAWVALQGAKDEQRFKDWTRNRQLATPVWFTAYPDRTLSNVENDVRIAQLLATEKTAEEDAALLALL